MHRLRPGNLTIRFIQTRYSSMLHLMALVVIGLI